MRRVALLLPLPVAGSDLLANATFWSPAPEMFEIAGQVSLFPHDGAVEVLVGNVSAVLAASSTSTAWIIDYYSSSCPHCWFFAAAFVQLAEAYSKQQQTGDTLKLRFGACNCLEEENKPSCTQAGVFSYPTLLAYRLTDESPAPVPTQFDGHEATLRELVDWIQQHNSALQRPDEAALWRPSSGNSTAATFAGAGAPPGSPAWPEEDAADFDRFNDARLGFEELLMGNYHSSDQFMAARRLTDLAIKAFPVHTTVWRNLQQQFSKQLAELPGEFKGIMLEWQRLFPSTSRMVCKTSPCTVWQLFHVLTTSLAGRLMSGTRLYLQEESVPSLDPDTVADTMGVIRDTVETFLACTSCRDHFRQAWDRCLYGRCEVLEADDEKDRAKAMVLWLWRLHNAVCMRQLAEHPPAATAAGPVDRRWPTFRDCPGCWKPEAVDRHGDFEAHAELTKDAAASFEADLDSVYDLDRVFGFLLRTYLGKENLVLDGVHQHVISEVGISRHGWWRWGAGHRRVPSHFDPDYAFLFVGVIGLLFWQFKGTNQSEEERMSQQAFQRNPNRVHTGPTNLPLLPMESSEIVEDFESL